jgi:twitching motility two-component system response regulator PilG
MPRNGTAAGAKNCLDVAFSSVWPTVAYSGKLYALVNLLEPWQTRLGSVSERGVPRDRVERRRAAPRRESAPGGQRSGEKPRAWGSYEAPMGNDVPSRSTLQGIKVMVIDDSNTIRRSAEIFLLQAGCTVILAEDGFDALAKIADHQPDLVFVDIMMPRLDGYQTCALIKKNSRFHAMPVVMLSSKDGLFDRARGRMVGSDQYLTKPFTKESLLKAVAAHVKSVTA